MLPEGYRKRSFLRFNTPLDEEILMQEFKSIPKDAWSSSYWGNVHCSIGMLLLRGGNGGDEQDFYSDDSIDHPLLRQLPYIKQVLSPNGPFGEVPYAFILKMKPNGVTLKHVDIIEKWKYLYRVHIPIVTNPGAYLISNDKSIHFEKGYAWTFDNQAEHGVVNGEEERVHLIFDVAYSDKIKRLIDKADCLDGVRFEEHINRINSFDKIISSYPGDKYLRREIRELELGGFSYSAIAELFNTKGIPIKAYSTMKWNADMIRDMSIYSQ